MTVKIDYHFSNLSRSASCERLTRWYYQAIQYLTPVDALVVFCLLTRPLDKFSSEDIVEILSSQITENLGDEVERSLIKLESAGVINHVSGDCYSFYREE